MNDQLDMFGPKPTPIFDEVADGSWRYCLTWPPGEPELPRALWVLHNPSVAGVYTSDRTAEKVRAFSLAAAFMRFGVSQPFGVEGFRIVNVWPYRATDPKKLWAASRAARLGVCNDIHIANAVMATAGPVVVGWGSPNPPAAARALTFEDIAITLGILRTLRDPIYCLGTNKDGSPKHPLYLPADTKLEVYR